MGNFERSVAERILQTVQPPSARLDCTAVWKPNPFAGKWPTRWWIGEYGRRIGLDFQPTLIRSSVVKPCAVAAKKLSEMILGGKKVRVLEFDRSKVLVRATTVGNLGLRDAGANIGSSPLSFAVNFRMYQVYHMVDRTLNSMSWLHTVLQEKYVKKFPYPRFGRTIFCRSGLRNWSQVRKQRYLANLEDLIVMLGEELPF